MRRRPNFFIITVFSILLIWFAYLGRQLVGLTGLDLATKLAWWFLLATPFCLMLWLPLMHWRDDDPTPAWLQPSLQWVSFISMGFLSFLLVGVVARDLLSLFVKAPDLYGGNVSTLVVLAALILLVLGVLLARRLPRIERVNILIKDLAPELVGFSIAQVSDLHVSHSIKRRYVERVVDSVNELNADAIALTGDIFDGDVNELVADTEPLTRLRAREGVFYVPGNHEYYWGLEAWLTEVGRLGMHALVNKHVVISRGPAQLALAGVPDAWAKRYPAFPAANPEASLLGAPKSAVKILLAHQPSTSTDAAAAGFALQLSGHTHGGQFFPWTLLARAFHRYPRGLHRLGEMWIYVNRGTGFWGPPVRLGSRSEITLVTLVSAN